MTALVRGVFDEMRRSRGPAEVAGRREFLAMSEAVADDLIHDAEPESRRDPAA